MDHKEQLPEDMLAAAISEAEKMNEYPLTPSQMGIYLACINDPNGTMYNIPVCYTFDKSANINIDALVKAIKTAVKNHEGMRFCVDASSGTPVMRPHNYEADIPVINIPDSELETAKSDFVKPFDLQKGPLFRFEIIKTETKLCLLADFHHIACDGTSLSAISNEISALYSGKTIEKEIVGQFGMSVYEKKFENTQEYESAKAYYENIFSDNEVKSRLVPDKGEDEAAQDKPCGRIQSAPGGFVRRYRKRLYKGEKSHGKHDFSRRCGVCGGKIHGAGGVYHMHGKPRQTR